MHIELQQLDRDLPLPARANAGDAGFDLYAREGAILPAGGQPTTFPTGIAVAIPVHFVGYVCSRSGLAAHPGIFVVNAPGVIDSGYRGELSVILANLGSEDYAVGRGDRIAQLVIQPAPPVEIVVVEELNESGRGTTGLGSTGT